MVSALRRFRNRFTWFGVPAIFLGVGMNVIYAFAPNIVTHRQAVVLVGVGIALVVIAGVLFLIGFLKTPLQVSLSYYDIIPILQEMDEHLRTLAKREARKKIDWKKYYEVNDKINKEILGLVPPKTKTIKGAKKAVAKLESSVKETYKDKVISIRGLIAKIEPSSNFLDASGFGLKEQRITNRKYLRLSRKLEYCRNLPIGSEVNDLIRLHIRGSEYTANMLLAIHRALGARQQVQGSSIGVIDLMSTEMRIGLESIESDMREVTYAIRARVGECLRELEVLGVH